MKALSLRQPWAWLVAAGYKTIETRTWGTKYRGLLLIHASGKWRSENADMFCLITHSGILKRSEIEHLEKVVIERNSLMRYTGGIIGSVHLKKEAHTYFTVPSEPCFLEKLYARYHLCVPIDHYDWDGKKGWWLENAQLFEEPIECKGALRLWTPPSEVIEKVNEAKILSPEFRGGVINEN